MAEKLEEIEKVLEGKILDEVLKQFLEEKFFKAKLEQTLLFLTSSLGLFISLLVLYSGPLFQGLPSDDANKLSDLLRNSILPFFIVGWFMPIYIGHFRGSLMDDDINERFRGWIYFLISLLFWISMSGIVVLTAIFAPTLSIELFRITIYIFVVICFLLFLLAPKIFGHIKIKLFKASNIKITFLERLTILCAIFLNVGIFYIVQRNLITTYSILISFVLFFAIVCELRMERRFRRPFNELLIVDISASVAGALLATIEYSHNTTLSWFTIGVITFSMLILIALAAIYLVNAISDPVMKWMVRCCVMSLNPHIPLTPSSGLWFYTPTDYKRKLNCWKI